MSRAFPVDVSGLDSKMLTDLLRTVDAGATATGFKVFDAQIFGDGQDKYRLRAVPKSR